MSNTIILFTLDNCIHCKSLKKRLRIESIPYTEIEITNNQKIWNEVVNQTGHNSLPTVYIKKENLDTGPVYVAGVDFMSDEEAINIIKKHI
jgi:glutaredoxin